MNTIENMAVRVRQHPRMCSYTSMWRYLKGAYLLGLKLLTLRRGLLRTLYPGVRVRVSYASRQTMEADFSVIANWDVPCLDLIRRWTEGNPQACVFDVGANHGQFGLVVSRWLSPDAKRVFAFEPHPGNREVLQENLARNQCRNVEVMDCALAAQAGTMTLYGESVTASFQPKLGPKTLVNVETLDGFCARTGLVPDVIKIDVEGFELEVLRGAVETLTRQQNSIKIICEMHTFMWPDPDFDLRLIALVESFGLSIFKLDGTAVSRISDYGHYVLAKQLL